MTRKLPMFAVFRVICRLIEELGIDWVDAIIEYPG
jgi:hypothetical protein